MENDRYWIEPEDLETFYQKVESEGEFVAEELFRHGYSGEAYRCKGYLFCFLFDIHHNLVKGLVR